MSNILMKCLDCNNSKYFTIPYIDRTHTTFNDEGDIEFEYSSGYETYDDERIVCAAEGCGSDNLNIYKEN